MPIQLTKTLQGQQYTLYIITTVEFIDESRALSVVQNIYQSQGHFDDDFLPIIRKRATVTNNTIVRSIRAVLRENYATAVALIETFLVNNVQYYQGGSVVNGIG